MAEQAQILPLPAPVLSHHGDTIFAPMQEWLSNGHVPPVLLLTGTQGIGKRNIAWFLTQWLFCEKTTFAGKPGKQVSVDSADDGFFGSMLLNTPTVPPQNTEDASSSTQPCGSCAACLRALHGNWVDFKEILPEPDSTILKIDQFRNLKSTLGFGAHEAPFRITLIPNADRMTVQAANSLLKLLEEPPPGWLFFLTASDPTLILPTVLSRCQTLRLKPFRKEILEQLLTSQGVDLTGGGETVVEFSDVQYKTLFAFIKTPSDQINPLVDWAALELENFTLLTDQLEYILHDLVSWSLAPENHVWVNADGRDSLIFHTTQGKKRFGTVEELRAFWLARAERLAQSRQEVLTPMNRKLLLQDLLLPWLLINRHASSDAV